MKRNLSFIITALVAMLTATSCSVDERTVISPETKNETEHMREINVEMVPYELSTWIHVTQLPAGVEELPDR